MTTQWLPYREPLGTTLLRTVAIAVLIGAVLAHYGGGLARWPMATLLALWPSFGGHWVELWFLNWLRPRISSARAIQIAARLGVWFVGGTLFALCMGLTAMALNVGPMRRPAWWVPGVGFIGIEMVVHLVLLLWRRPNFYDGRG